MAHFYGELKGNKGKVTRGGSKNSGIYAHIRGWSVGVHTEMYKKDGKDYFKVYKTGGSNNENNKILIYDSLLVESKKEVSELLTLLENE